MAIITLILAGYLAAEGIVANHQHQPGHLRGLLRPEVPVASLGLQGSKITRINPGR